MFLHGGMVKERLDFLLSIPTHGDDDDPKFPPFLFHFHIYFWQLWLQKAILLEAAYYSMMVRTQAGMDDGKQCAPSILE